MSLHEEVAEQTLHRILRNPEAAETLDYQRDLIASGDSPQYVARIGQTHQYPRAWPLAQVAAYVMVHNGLMSGRYLWLPIGVGAEPGPDAAREGNAAKLQGVNEHFRARLHMTQNGASADGRLSWDGPIHASRSTGTGFIASCGTVPVRAPLTLPAGDAPLEVGSSLPSVTYLHLERDGGVARWAYGDDEIALFVNVDHPKVRKARAKAREQADG